MELWREGTVLKPSEGEHRLSLHGRIPFTVRGHQGGDESPRVALFPVSSQCPRGPGTNFSLAPQAVDQHRQHLGSDTERESDHGVSPTLGALGVVSAKRGNVLADVAVVGVEVVIDDVE